MMTKCVRACERRVKMNGRSDWDFVVHWPNFSPAPAFPSFLMEITQDYSVLISQLRISQLRYYCPFHKHKQTIT